MLVTSTALDMLLVCFTRWRWYRRRKGKRRRRVAAKQEEREPGFKLRQEVSDTWHMRATS